MKNSPTHFDKSAWLAPFATTAMFGFEYAWVENSLTESELKYFVRGVDEDGKRGVPSPLWNATPCAELIASSDTLPRSFFWPNLIWCSTSSWYSCAVMNSQLASL